MSENHPLSLAEKSPLPGFQGLGFLILFLDPSCGSELQSASESVRISRHINFEFLDKLGCGSYFVAFWGVAMDLGGEGRIGCEKVDRQGLAQGRFNGAERMYICAQMRMLCFSRVMIGEFDMVMYECLWC